MPTRAKLITRLTLLMALTFTHANAYASGVFKCIDADGSTTFSFTTCPSIAAPVVKPVETSSEKPRRVEVDHLNSSITLIQSELDALKKSYEQSLLAKHQNSRSDDLTHNFDAKSSELFQELARLQARKAKLSR